MVPFGGLLLEVLPLLELLGVGEGDAVDALEGLGVRLALPVGGRVLRTGGDARSSLDCFGQKRIRR